MRKILHGFILLLLCSPCCGWAAADQTEVRAVSIKSAVLAEQRELVVYLPAGYQQSNERYPVFYLTDGDIQGPHTAGTIDYLAKFEQMPPMIVVGIVNRQHRERDLTLTPKDQQKPNQPQNADRFLAFVENEVIPYVKQNYRTLDYQVLSGTSHGGQFAINALVKRPGLFNAIIAISPSLYWDNNQLLGLTEQALKQNRLQGRLFVSIANEEPTMTAPYQQFVDLLARSPSDKLVVASQTFSDETHNTTVLQGQYAALKHVFSGWAIPEGQPQTLADLQAKFASRAKLLKADLLIPEDKANGYGQWLQYLNRQQDALVLLQWNRTNYPQSFHAHTALINAYLHFKMAAEAKAAQKDALQSLKGLSTDQKAQLEALVI
jgi:hypothetical protein